jgi:hypothetical protein
LRNPIHRFFDGTCIDMSQMLDISAPRLSNTEASKVDLLLEFSITYKGRETPRVFSFPIKEAVDTHSLGHALTTAYWDGVDGIGQIALAALAGCIDELVTDWANFRTEELACNKR